MYYYPSHYEPRYEHPSDYTDYSASLRKPRYVTTRYYYGNPYLSCYNDGRYELLRRTPIYSATDSSYEEGDYIPRRIVRATSIPPRASSIPPRASSIPPRYSRASSIPPRGCSPGLDEDLRHSVRASSVPPIDTSSSSVTYRPQLVSYSPNMADTKTPTTTYTYYTRIPTDPSDKAEHTTTPKRMFSANPPSFGPRMYTNLSVFPTMRHSSYNLLAPIDRYRYRTVPTKAYSGYPSTSYYSYPTPTRSTASAYRASDIYPTRFQINRVTSPSVDRFYAGRRTVY